MCPWLSFIVAARYRATLGHFIPKGLALLPGCLCVRGLCNSNLCHSWVWNSSPSHATFNDIYYHQFQRFGFIHFVREITIRKLNHIATGLVYVIPAISFTLRIISPYSSEILSDHIQCLRFDRSPLIRCNILRHIMSEYWVRICTQPTSRCRVIR